MKRDEKFEGGVGLLWSKGLVFEKFWAYIVILGSNMSQEWDLNSAPPIF